jgi:hypothetical protein
MMQTNFRGKNLTREEVERAMERFDREFRDTFRRWKTYSVKHNDRRYPPKELLRILVGDIGGYQGANLPIVIFGISDLKSASAKTSYVGPNKS